MQKLILTLLFLGFSSIKAFGLPYEEYVKESKAQGGQWKAQVLESHLSGNYLFLKLEKDGQTIWAATLNSYEASQGDWVSFKKVSPMKDFYSKSMNKTFTEILFLSSIENLSHENR